MKSTKIIAIALLMVCVNACKASGNIDDPSARELSQAPAASGFDPVTDAVLDRIDNGDLVRMQEIPKDFANSTKVLITKMRLSQRLQDLVLWLLMDRLFKQEQRQYPLRYHHQYQQHSPAL